MKLVVGYLATSGGADAVSLGVRLARTLGAKPAALMRGHGAVVVGENLPRAVGRSVYLELSARMQMQALLLAGERGSITYLDDAEVDSLFDLAQTDGIMPLVRKTAQFNQHRHLIRALFKHPPARRILFRSLVG